MIAEVPFLPDQTECPCNPDEFLDLSNTTANIKDDLNETRQILQTTRDERDELQLEAAKLRSIPDPETVWRSTFASDSTLCAVPFQSPCVLGNQSELGGE